MRLQKALIGGDDESAHGSPLGRFGGYGYGLGHSGMGLGGVILMVLIVLLLLGKL